MAGALRQVMVLRRSAHAAKAMRGSAWSIGGYGVQTALRFISRIVLAKLLLNAAPLGTVAVITTILTGLEMISDLGINVTIVQHRDGADARFLGTAFSVQALRGGALYLLSAAIAYPVAWIYRDPQLAPLLLFAGLSVLFRGFANPGLSVLNRQVDLRRPTIVNLVSEVVGFAVTIVWAVKQPSAWALVAGTVATAAAFAIASHLAAARVKFAWSGAIAKGIAQFGGWIILSTGTYFLASRGEVLMLKGSIPDVLFGCFAFASMLVTTPLNAINQLAGQVMLPMLAGWVREDTAMALRQFRRAKWAFTALSLCVAWGAILLGPPIVALLHLNKSYAALGWMVQFLGFRAAFDVFAMPAGNALLASGAYRYCAFANVVRLVVLIAGLLLTVHTWGLPGAIWVLVAAPVLAYLSLLPGLMRQMPGTVRLEIACLLTFTGGSAVAGVFALLIARGSGGL
jgi:O-antigen/teichoic acid export membrane protein